MRPTSLFGRQYIVEVLGDEAIEKYGRGDLYDVFRMIMPFGLFKACESERAMPPEPFDRCIAPFVDPGSPRGRGRAHTHVPTVVIGVTAHPLADV